MRIAIKFAYDGRSFHGFARQPDLKTVEGEILSILSKNNIIKNAKESQFRYASRTDKKVSALGNIISFNTEKFEIKFLKNISSKDIIFYGFAKIKPDFYPRYAKHRHYRYYLKNQNLDFEKILDASNCFIGEHNFSNFARLESNKDPYRIIENIIITKNKKFLIFDFFAQTFLWHQIRRMISALEKVGFGKLEKDQIINALDDPDEKVDFGLASAEPLILKNVVYDFEFEVDNNLVKKVNNLDFVRN